MPVEYFGRILCSNPAIDATSATHRYARELDMIKLILAVCLLLAGTAGAQTFTDNQVKVDNGILQGSLESSAVHIFKGIPFAQPPVGDLRWRPPQPAKDWPGVRPATKFGPRAIQGTPASDTTIRTDQMGEDCLYLNVWTPAKTAEEHLPVLVWFYGGGFQGGDGSEVRYDGESIAQRGIVYVTVNYRLGIFGFMAHPELTQESPHHASGDYGLLDQNAALKWVQTNIAAFRGRPEESHDRGTIGRLAIGMRSDGLTIVQRPDIRSDRRERFGHGHADACSVAGGREGRTAIRPERRLQIAGRAAGRSGRATVPCGKQAEDSFSPDSGWLLLPG